MKRYVALLILAGTMGGGVRLTADADMPVRVAVSPAITIERGNAQVKVLIQRNDENRVLAWEVDGPDYYRSSTTTLDGASAPRSWFFQVRNLPEGTFAVRATVRRSDNSESVAQARLLVVPSEIPDER